MKPLTLFIQPGILEQIGFARLAKFLDSFADDLKAANLTIPPLKHMNRFYFAEVAHFLAATNDLPDSLRQTMATLESAAARQNEHQLDTLIKRHIPNVSLNRSCPLDCALELWFIAPELFLSSSLDAPKSDEGGLASPKLLSEGGSSSPEQSEVPIPNRDSSSSISGVSPFKVQGSTVPGSTVPGSTVQSSTVQSSTVQSSTVQSSTVPGSTVPGLPDRGTSPARSSHEPTIDTGHPASHEAPGSSSDQSAIENLPLSGTKIKNGEDQDQAALQALAHLSLVEYDRTRKQSARSLGIRVETLDAEVTRVRNQLVEDAMLQTALATLRSPEPWPEPVDGAQVLTQIVERFLYYVILPPGAPEALTLWSTHAHCFFAFIQSPRLNICSPEGGCGKTTALDVIATLTPRALRTENLTAPVLFRLVHQHQPTLLLDEVDSWLPQAEELRGLLNAGHKRGACAYRCEGEGNAVRPFRAFGPAVLSGIGQLTGTLHDRSIVVPLMKAEAGQILHRFDNHRIEIETELCRKLARWTADNFAALKGCEPPLPPTAFNRLADNWRPLFAIAQIAGGPWPELALNSFNHLAKSSSFSSSSSISGPAPSIQSSGFDGSTFNGSSLPAPPPPSPVGRLSTASPIETSLGSFKVQGSTIPGSTVPTQPGLLAAILQIFTQSGTTRISSQQLAQALTQQSTNPAIQQSGAGGCARPRFTPVTLSRCLRQFGIKSKVMRFGDHLAKGYELADFPHSTDPQP